MDVLPVLRLPGVVLCEVIKSLNIERSLTVSVIFILKGIKTFWNNHREGFLSLILITTYNCYSYQSTLSELFDVQVVEFKTLTIELKGSKDEKLLWKQIISNFWQVEDLRIFSVANSGFIPVFTSWPQKINIRNSYWFTLETILACTSTTILLGRSRLENKDLDVILRKWKAGGFLTLKRLTIDSRNFTGDGEQI
ncbi:hypothetical protein CRE_22059 [Caenorhabditis remanei]|uniref:Sdz-33 F-box domain-containing protein n=1 Tax=Caenorhabditis remanei TaxID=31234 RepID=E3N3L4_CAERE|nr:hypothetical protein CRE_22059 [Caenorhabditis remanei]